MAITQELREELQEAPIHEVMQRIQTTQEIVQKLMNQINTCEDNDYIEMLEFELHVDVARLEDFTEILATRVLTGKW